MVTKTFDIDSNASLNLGPNGEFLSSKSIYVGDHPNQYVLPSTRDVVLFDDFLGDALDARWSGAKGSDAQAVVPTITADPRGQVRLTAGDTVTTAESLSSLTHGLNWKPANGLIVFETKFTPVTSVANVSYFIGLTDTLATTTLEEPLTLSTATWTSNAKDAVGFVYDTAGTVPGFYCMAVANDVDATAPITNAVPVADTAVVLRIEVDTSGNATFYRDGVSLGTLAVAVTPSIALTPIVSVMARTTTSKSADLDYVYVAQSRV